MGLFVEAKKYNGIFYRAFSQSVGSPDLNNYFNDNPVIHFGICAGSCLDWIEFYLTRNADTLYSNSIMQQNQNKIVTIQRALRLRDQSIVDLMLKYGMKPHNTLSPFQIIVTTQNSEEIAFKTTAVHSLNVIRYEHPKFGAHVVAYYIDKNKNLYFTDNQKGDVMIPYPHSSQWLKRYFDLFIRDCGHLELARFKPEWNKEQAEAAYHLLAKDAIMFQTQIDLYRTRSTNHIEFNPKPLIHINNPVFRMLSPQVPAKTAKNEHKENESITKSISKKNR